MIELAVALAVLALMTGAALGWGRGHLNRASLLSAVDTMHALRTGLQRYGMDAGGWPPGLGSLQGRYIPTGFPLQSLWGTPYQYQPAGRVAYVWTDVPTPVSSAARFGAFFQVIPLSSTWTRVVIAATPPGATSDLEVERRRITGGP